MERTVLWQRHDSVGAAGNVARVSWGMFGCAALAVPNFRGYVTGR